MTQTTLAVRVEDPIGTIGARLYGQFAEHLGRCCYDGLWTGERFRMDVVEALRALPVPLLRWPGGCYADHYHWRDGIGAPAVRPRRLGMSCGATVEDDNSLGTHEFLQLCRLIGAEPYLAGNVGTGTPQELCDWLEYCNSPFETDLTRMRRANGAPEPFGVPLWGVGNENWGCGGNYDAVVYAHEYRRYATMLRHVDSSAELVACGFDDTWNERLLGALEGHVKLVDHLSIHRYWHQGGPAVDFSDDQYYTLLGEAAATEDFVRRTAELIAQVAPADRSIGIALDEWGVWHPEARLNASPVYEQPGTLRDALAAGIALEGFHRQCNVLTLANMAQVVNVLQSVVNTDGGCMWKTPTYHALHLHAPHIGATALPVEVAQAESLPGGEPAVSATASLSGAGIAVTVINRHRDAGAEVCIDLGRDLATARGELLTADAPNAANSANEPDLVAPRDVAVAIDNRRACRIDLPAHSMATIKLT